MNQKLQIFHDLEKEEKKKRNNGIFLVALLIIAIEGLSMEKYKSRKKTSLKMKKSVILSGSFCSARASL